MRYLDCVCVLTQLTVESRFGLWKLPEFVIHTNLRQSPSTLVDNHLDVVGVTQVHIRRSPRPPIGPLEGDTGRQTRDERLYVVYPELETQSHEVLSALAVVDLQEGLAMPVGELEDHSFVAWLIPFLYNGEAEQ